MNKSKPVVILGCGGHASVLVDILTQQHVEVLAVVSPVAPDIDSNLSSLLHLKNDDDVFAYLPEDIELVNGIGFVPTGNFARCSSEQALRNKLFYYFKSHGYLFKTIVSNFAVVASNAQLDEGVQIMHGCIIQTNVKIKANSIINTRVVLEHDCQIAAHNHIATGAILCGSVRTEQYVFIGAGATVIQGVAIGVNTMIAAGALVRKDVAANSRLYANHQTTS